ncbi:MAG: hypothetical protein ABSF45_16270 [Terriglobia bacterium]|jgi:hypothetical protein
MDVMTRNAQLINDPGSEFVLRRRPDRQDGRERSSLIEGATDARDNIQRKFEIEGLRIFDDSDAELGVGVLAELCPSNPPNSCADRSVAKGEELG